MNGSRGFTLIEVLVALGLTALLMVATLGLTRSLSESVQTDPAAADRARLLEKAIDRIEADLRQCHHWQIEDGALVLQGPIAVATARGPAQDPAEVRYIWARLHETDPAATALIRRQRRLLDTTNRPDETEVLLLGVEAFEVALPSTRPAPDAGPQAGNTPKRQPDIRLLLRVGVARAERSLWLGGGPS